ncbi:efflux RND transporter permease subunit [Sulfurospirillum sp. 1612]|uniref:efflux RND transporter permease subunit n=1 Tax=Sulfurospirillum sp. 1612 TaxID=3094835 RepID=UPI002F922FE2
MFSRFFINRPIFATVVSLLIIIGGIVAIQILPVKQYPAVAPPQINVTATYPGADASTLAKTVASTLEDAINGVENMDYMTSTASPSGTLTVSVFFNVGTDVNQAKVDINNRVQLALSKLPEEVQRQGISVKERSPDMLKVISFWSKGDVHDRLFISNYLTVNVLDALKRIKGVGEAQVFGAKDYAIRVWVDPGKLQFYGLSTAEVMSIIKNQNNQYAAGSVGHEPLKVKKPFTYIVTTDGRLKTPKEFGNIIIRSNPDGSALRLKDIARISLASDAYTTIGRYSGHPMIPVGIFLSAGANALDVSKAVDDTLKQLSSSFPEDLQYNAPYDTTVFVQASIDEVVKTLFEAMVFVTILIYIFLGNLRATIIPILAIPVSIIGTFAGLYVAGFSINLLTLFGLILAIGLVVDDAIIVIENVERILATKSLSVKEATIEAMKELTTPIVAIVLVLSAVFVPAALSGGFSGVMYQQFAMTIVMAVVISGIVALTLTPALCAIFLKEHESAPIWPLRKFNQFFEWSTKVFLATTRKTIKLWAFSLLLFGGLLYTTYHVMEKLPTGLVPNEDQGLLLIIEKMMPATSLASSSKIAANIENQILKNPNIEGIGSITGLDITTFAFTTDAGIIFAKLKPWDQRKLPSQNSQALAGAMFGQFMQDKDAFVIPVNPPPISGMSITGGFEMWIQDKTGGNLSDLNKYVQAIIAEASKDPILMGLRTTLNTNIPQYRLSVDREKAKSMNVPISSIFATLTSTFGQGYVNDFNMYGKTYHVDIQSDSQFRSTKKSYSETFVKSTTGTLIPLSELIHVKRVVNANVIQRFNMFNAAKITGNPRAGYTSSDAMNAIESIAKKILPQGYSIAWSGTSYQEKLLEKKGNYTTIYAALFVFLILAALYESWSIPLAVIISIPFAIFGASLAVLLRDVEADVYFQVGLVTLVGLSAKNAILIVEFAMDKLKEGMSVLDATIEAARLRFRPIIMTSMAFIVGTLPLALSSGAGANSRQIMGTTVVGGMIAATVIGVFFIPLFFYLVVRVKQFFSRKKIEK